MISMRGGSAREDGWTECDMISMINECGEDVYDRATAYIVMSLPHIKVGLRRRGRSRICFDLLIYCTM